MSTIVSPRLNLSRAMNKLNLNDSEVCKLPDTRGVLEFATLENASERRTSRATNDDTSRGKRHGIVLEDRLSTRRRDVVLIGDTIEGNTVAAVKRLEASATRCTVRHVIYSVQMRHY